MPNNGDTLLCWDTAQAKVMLKAIVMSDHKDSLLAATEEALAECQELKLLGDRESTKQAEKILFLEEANTNLVKMVGNQKKLTEDAENEAKRQKRHKVKSIGATLLVSVLAILK